MYYASGFSLHMCFYAFSATTIMIKWINSTWLYKHSFIISVYNNERVNSERMNERSLLGKTLHKRSANWFDFKWIFPLSCSITNKWHNALSQLNGQICLVRLYLRNLLYIFFFMLIGLTFKWFCLLIIFYTKP